MIIFQRQFQILLLLCFLFCKLIYSQEKKILLLPLQTKMIVLDKGTREMFNYNKINYDSAQSKISNLVTERFVRNFNEYKIESVLQNSALTYLNDSLSYYQKWNSFRVQEFENSGKLGKALIISNTNPSKDYIGRYISEKFIDSLKQTISKNNYTYFALVNKLEVKNHLFKAGKNLIIHFEIYNKSANRIYGGTYNFDIALSNRTYGDVFFYFLKNCLD